MKTRLCLSLLLLLSVSACDLLGIPDPAKEAAAKDAEGKAVGGACRHAGRALEDCFTLNPSAPKASVFTGWKDMNDYMVQNKIDVVKPVLPPPSQQSAAAKAAAASEADSAPAEEEAPTAPAKSARERGKGGAAAH